MISDIGIGCAKIDRDCPIWKFERFVGFGVSSAERWVPYRHIIRQVRRLTTHIFARK
jgi:hypothetical protein